MLYREACSHSFLSPPELQLLVDRSHEFSMSLYFHSRAGGRVHQAARHHDKTCLLMLYREACSHSFLSPPELQLLVDRSHEFSMSLYFHSATTAGHQQTKSHPGFARCAGYGDSKRYWRKASAAKTLLLASWLKDGSTDAAVVS